MKKQEEEWIDGIRKKKLLVPEIGKVYPMY